MSITYNEPGVTYDDPLYTYDGGAVQPISLHFEFAPGVASSAVPTAGQWVDITSRVSTMNIDYGRTDELSQPSAGSMDLTLDNSDGAMDPDNASGPYAGQLLPLVWFRAYNRGDTDTDLFYGQVSIEGWRLQASQFPDSYVTVTVLDMFEQMANTYLPSSVYEIEVKADNPRAWYRLGESSGTVATDSSGNGYHGTYEGGATFNSRAGLVVEDPDNAIGFDGVDDWARLPASAAAVGADLTMEGWFSTEGINDTVHVLVQGQNLGVTVPSAVLAYAPSTPAVQFKTTGADGGIESASAIVNGLNDGKPHHLVGTRSGNTMRVYVDGTLRATATVTARSLSAVPLSIGSPEQAAPGGTPVILDEVAIYDSALSATRIAAHHAAGTKPWEGDRTDQRITKLLDAAGFPAPLRTIEAGASTLRRAALGTDLLSALQQVTATERGELYIDHANGGKVRFRGRRARWTATASTTAQATFGDGGGTEVPVSAMGVEDDRIVNRASVQRFNGATVSALSAASETTYQRRSHSESGLLFTTDAESQSRADLIVNEKAERRRRVRSVTLEPRADNHPAWPQVFARRLGDRVLVRWRPPYGGTYDFASYVEGAHHSYTAAGRALRTTFDLSPVPYGGVAGETTYWIWDVSKWDTDTRWGY